MREDWVECNLNMICDIYPGIGFPKEKQGKQEGEYPFYKVGDISKNVQSGNRFLRYCDNYIDKGDIANIKNKILPPNSITFAKIGEALKLNRRCITTKYSLIDNNAIGIKAREYLTDLYLYFYFLTIRLEEYSRATTVPSVRKSDIENIKIPLPPLPEQRAIVSKIESLFSDLDKGIEDLNKAKDQLKIYRQAVLKKAFEGELIQESKKEKLKNITSKIGSGSTPKGGQANYKESGTPLVRSLNIHFDYIKFKGLAFIDEEQAEKLKNVIIYEGDVLLNITGASIGRVNLAPKDFHNGRVNQHVSIIRPKSNSFIPKFLKLYLQSSDIQNWIMNANYGVTRQALTKDQLENLEVPLPEISKQKKIIQEIESRLSVCDKVEQSIVDSLEKAKALRQSILKKAFEGKLLTAAEIEKCKAKKDYEPASVLLARIEQSRNERIKKEKKK